MPVNENSKDLLSVLWAGADILRGKMDANEYKNYLLGIVFYKYLSDTFLTHVYDLLYNKKPDSMADAQAAYEEVYNTEDAEELLEDIKESYHYTIEPELTYTKLAETASKNAFQREMLKKAFNQVEQADPIFANLFADVDLYSTRLGAGEQKQSATVAEVVKKINEADLLNHEGDVLGDAYEYLIGQFASETGKKAGEFYTPQAVSQILTRVAIQGQEDKQGLLVYDAAMGSGSLLLNARKFSHKPDYIRYFGQELSTTTYNLARMNMFLHGVDPENQTLRNADTLDADWPTDEETDFDMVLMNPPYSAKWSAAQGFLNDSRFSDYGVLAPKSKADYAFLLHGFYHLKNTGTMAIILPHGVLLKNRDGRDILFIDASQQFVKGKKQNSMSPENIDHIIELYTNRTNVEKEAHLATYEEIKANDYNLNIPRYVDTFEQEEQISLSDLASEFSDISADMDTAATDLIAQMGELTGRDENTNNELAELMKVLEGIL